MWAPLQALFSVASFVLSLGRWKAGPSTARHPRHLTPEAISQSGKPSSARSNDPKQAFSGADAV